MRISDWSSDVFSSDLRVPEFQWFRRGSTTRLLRHRTGTMLGTPAMATRANNRKTLHWRRSLHKSRPIGDGSACDAASVIMRHPATPAPCGKGRSEERRVGKEGVSTGRSRWPEDHEKTNKSKEKN